MATFEYTPGSAGNLPVSAEVRRFLDEELRRISDALNLQQLYTQPLAAPPAKPEDGVIVYADGVNWNPGSGAGFYGYESSSWVKL